MVKKEIGQKNQFSPTLIIEGTRHHTTPKNIAEAMNRQYIQNVRKVISEMPTPGH